ncbi:MAG: hypothetical protein WC661_12085 [Opitutaceae bacterium]|jgi:hypothetical protein
MKLSLVRSLRGGWLALAVVLAAGLLGGCASTTKSADRRDVSVIRTGVARAEILKELGTPVSSTKSKDGNQVDIFTFVQGVKPAGQVPRPIEREEADAQMLKVMLKQTGFSPDAIFDGKTLTVQVNYDQDERVVDTFLLDMKSAP